MEIGDITVEGAVIDDVTVMTVGLKTVTVKGVGIADTTVTKAGQRVAGQRMAVTEEGVVIEDATVAIATGHEVTIMIAKMKVVEGEGGGEDDQEVIRTVIQTRM